MSVDHATALRMREKFPLDKSPARLQARIAELELADLVGEFGVLNRRAIDSKLQRMAGRIVEGNLDEFTGMLVVMADLDGLRQINNAGGDNQGHDMGDAALINAFQMIAQVRPYDTVARLGGDEAGVVMMCGSAEQAKQLAEGTGEREGYIPRTQRAIAEGVAKLKARYLGRWVKDTVGKEPGNVTMGWAFVSREEFVNLYKQWISDKGNQQAGVGDFATYVFGQADKAMMQQKSKNYP